jgi:hypothetical protein
MNDPHDARADAVESVSANASGGLALDVWLAERELLSAAFRLQDPTLTTQSSEREREARIAYQAAWLRFLVALCNLPLSARPSAVEHMIDRLRDAHLSLGASHPAPFPSGSAPVPVPRPPADGRPPAPIVPEP